MLSNTSQRTTRIATQLRSAKTHFTLFVEYLVNLYAKSGDYQGCLMAHEDMLAGSIAPTLALYALLIASCDGHIAHAIYHKAGNAGWTAWQELF
jgi:hypothetical protein